MDEYESDRASEAPRLSLDATEKNDGTCRLPRVGGRSKSPTPMLFPSSNTTGISVPKRADSAERRRPTTPSSTRGLSSPFHGASMDMESAARKMSGSKLTDSLWPSRTRNESAPFQFDTSSLSITKKENQSHEALSDPTSKPSSNVAKKQTEMLVASSGEDHTHEALSEYTSKPSSNVAKKHTEMQPAYSGDDQPHEAHFDSTSKPSLNVAKAQTEMQTASNREDQPYETFSDIGLKPSSNVSYKQDAMLPASSKAAPERMGTIPKGENVNGQQESSKPPDGLNDRLVERHRWPSATGSNVLSKNINLLDESTKTSNITDTTVVAPSPGRMSLPNYSSKPLKESSSDVARLFSDDAKLNIDKSVNISTSLADDGSLDFDELQRVSNIYSSNSSQKTELLTATARSHSLPPSESQSSSPNKSNDSASRGMNPSRTRPITCAPAFATRVSPSPACRGINPSPAATKANLYPSATRVSPASLKGVGPYPAATGVSLSMAAKEVNPSLIATGVSPILCKRVNPSPATTGVNTASSRGVNPSPTITRVNISPSTTVVNPAPSRDVNHTPAATMVNLSPPREISHTPIVTMADPTPSRGVSPTPTATMVVPTSSRGVSPTPPTTGVNFITVVKGVDPAPSRTVSPTLSTSRVMPTKGIDPTISRGVDPILGVRGVSPTPSAKEVNPTPVAQEARPTPSTRGASPTPVTKEMRPTPSIRGSIPTPAAKEARPTPSTKGANPIPAAEGTSPMLAARGSSPTPLTRWTNPAPTAREVNHTSTAKGTILTPTSKGTILATHVRDANLYHDARGVSPTHIRPPSPKQSCNSNANPISLETGPSPAKGGGSSLASKVPNLSPLRGVGHFLSSLGLSLTPIINRVSSTPSGKEVSPPRTLRGVSPTLFAREVSSPRTVRGVNPTPTMKTVVPPDATRGINRYPASGVGPSAKGASQTPLRPSSPRKTSNSNIFSIFTEFGDGRKGKVSDDIEDAKYLELLCNIQVQWQFLNASTEAAMDLQKATAEESLFNASRATSALRASIAAKKTDLDLLILQLKLYAVLNRQMPYIDEWASIQREHESALAGAMNDLQASTCRLPITGGAKTDIKSLKKVVQSTLREMLTMASSIQSALSKLDGMHSLAFELAALASHERALLDQCQNLLASADPLRVEECSLRARVIQSKQTCKSEN